MSRRAATVAARTVAVLSVAMIGSAWAVGLASGTPPVFDVASSGLVLAVLPVVGALVVSRLPRHPVGWLFLGAGGLFAVAGAAHAYAVLVLSDGGSETVAVVAAWLASWLFLPAFFAVPPLLFLIFPDGRLPGRRWRWVVWLTVFSLVTTAGGTALQPGPLDPSPVPGLDNPFGVPSSGVYLLENLGWSTALASLLLATWSMVGRYRRSRGIERLQLQWFTTAAVVFLGACAINVAFFWLGLAPLGQAVVVVGFCVIPLATGTAILRYRLYDIHVVISRTLVYGALTASLVVVYLVSVLVLRLALAPFTGQSDLAVAASTLAVAALFRPLRARIQRTVDRRFYRRRYDAARTLQDFTGRLRQEVDLQTTASDLRDVVREAMQPEHVSLWLRRRTPDRHQPVLHGNDSRTPGP